MSPVTRHCAALRDSRDCIKIPILNPDARSCSSWARRNYRTSNITNMSQCSPIAEITRGGGGGGGAAWSMVVIQIHVEDGDPPRRKEIPSRTQFHDWFKLEINDKTRFIKIIQLFGRD